MNVAVILVAAGSGVRLGAGVPKAFAPLCGEPLLAHALRGVLGCGQVGHVVVVAPSTHLQQARDVVHPASCADASANARVDVLVDVVARVDVLVDVVAGGADRSASVAAGLAALRHDDGIVLVHDAARCLTPSDLFARVIREVRSGHPAVVPGLAMTDTVKLVDAQGRVLATPDRESLRAIQTPQGFLREVLEHAHAGGASASDDAGLVEQVGGQVRVVEGHPRALKVTSALSLTVAAALLKECSHAG